MTGRSIELMPQDDREARMAWSQVIEPGERPAIAVVEHMGAEQAWLWMLESGQRIASEQPHDVPQRLTRSVLRWFDQAQQVRLDQLRRDVAGSDATVVIPSDPQWPPLCDSLDGDRPICLWLRGNVNWWRDTQRTVSLVGARAATNYGIAIASDFAADLAHSSTAVISGGAFGIDIAAHRGAYGVGGTTVAFLAGGIDNMYPKANETTLLNIAQSSGAVISELGPGAKPLRSRFLRRNRLIAAAGQATVVVEAGMRSGAMSTARHASELLRPLGAVPGPITSRVSQGCHALIRDALAVCVTSVSDIAELVGSSTAESTEQAGQSQEESPLSYFPQPVVPSRPADTRRTTDDRPEFTGGADFQPPPWLATAMTTLIAQLRRGRGQSLDELVMATGLAANTVLAALGELELRGAAAWRGRGWQRTNST